MFKQLIQFKPHLCVRYSSTWKEIRIPVPWGHIAGKWWGPQDKRPILATHGWQDNSGTFDTLFPFLPKDTSFLAVDFPGCGLSSKLPPGTFYHSIDLVVLYRRIVKYFNWPTISLLGHSMGSAVNFVYTMLYPDEVDFLISLDSLKPYVEDEKITYMGREIDDFIKLDYLNSINGSPKSCSFQEWEQKLHRSLGSISVDRCKYILERNLKPSSDDPNKFYFTADPRLKIFILLNFSQRDFVENANRITCPVLYYKSSQTPAFEKSEYNQQVIDVLEKNNKRFEMHHVDGTHHVHLNSPERLEGPLNRFLKKYDIQDRSNSGLKQEILVQ